MNKIAQYLNEHILGEITASKAIRQQFSRDGSVLSITPELVMFPRVTNDIRKAARFAWQLAEKGHVLPVTVRGFGGDQTGASIGKGLMINTTAHLNSIIFVATKEKDRFVHVQPGVTFKTLSDTLLWHGLYIPAAPEADAYSTVGGVVANNSGGQFSGRYGLIGDWVTRLEVVLANGDLIETTRLSRREFNKKIGLQTFEGELYRKLDGLIEDNQELITKELAQVDRDNTGYARIAKVKQRDGSFDLTPLFIGSQGTLGIISEIVLKADYTNKDQTILVASVASGDTARDIADSLQSLEPASLDIIDGALFKAAVGHGKTYSFIDTDTDDAAVLYVQWNDFSDAMRARKLKKAIKLLGGREAMITTSDDVSVDELLAVRQVAASLYANAADGHSYVPLIDGAQIPGDRQEEFAQAVRALAVKHHLSLPLHVRVLDGTVFTRPLLQLDKVADKQKVFKLMSEYASLVEKHGGIFVADGSEGRLKANAAYSVLDQDVRRLYEEIRAIFDPFGTLNPGVKQSSDIKDLVHALRSDYDTSDFAQFAPHN